MKIDEIASVLKNVRKAGNGYSALCPVPGHDDRNNSLSLGERDDGRILVKCFGGCSAEDVVKSLGLELTDLFPDTRNPRNRRKQGRGQNPPVKCVTALQSPGLRLGELAQAKKLPEEFLRQLGLTECKHHGAPAVRIPYFSLNREIKSVRFRLSLAGPGRFVWRAGNKVALYGLDQLEEIRKTGWVLLVEGESDCWTAWHHKLPALGVPGKTCWRPEWKEFLEGLSVYLWQEPAAEDLSLRVFADVPRLAIIPAPAGIKDLSEAHIQGSDLPELLEDLKSRAIPAQNLIHGRDDAAIAVLQELARPILESVDPLAQAEQAIRALGYGGDIKPALITYLAVTSRLLKIRSGSMPVHLLLLGPSSAGKSYTAKVVLRLLPPDAYHEINAGSPRVLIYDAAELKHRVTIFGESDSLPAGEDNPAASAIRNLLQDHQLKYKVTIRDANTGSFRVHEVVKPGPTVLLTTAVRRLGPQLDTRVFTLDVPDDLHQLRQALITQGQIEIEEVAEPDPALIFYQAYLQALAPWDVLVPFAPDLSQEIGESIASPRLLRDFNRLLSLIKAVTVLRHRQRRRDEKGRLIAEIEDYATVYELVKGMYEATVTGATERVRDLVEAVGKLNGAGGAGVSVTQVANHLAILKMAASRAVKTACAHVWLVNNEKRRGYPASLVLGEPLPERAGLPAPKSLETCNGVTPETGGSPSASPVFEEVF